MQKQETTIQKGEYSSQRDDSNANRERNAKDRCPYFFRILHKLSDFLSGIDSKNTCSSGGFQHAFSSFFGEEVEYFAPKMFFNLNKLENQLNNEESDEEWDRNRKQDERSRSGNDIRAEGADIRLSNNTKRVNKVQSAAAYNVFANDRQHAE
ncbi:hypothetical protein Tco_0880858 [Tanacetum coccineum]